MSETIGHTIVNIAAQSWSVLGEMAPYLLFGFLAAGVLSVLISPEFVERHLGGRGFWPVVKATLFGIPLPLCSCGVIPVAASFRRHGASRAATTSFLLSTPQTGIDSILITYALLGFTFAAFRPFAALATGLVGGLLVMLFAQPNGVGEEAKPPRCEDECCTGDRSKSAVRRAIEYGFVTLPRDIGIELLVGIVIAGAITALVPTNQWQSYLGGGIVSIALAMLIGVPIYVCAAASVPIAVGLIHMGASPGTALAFLIAGPATNAATITTIWKLLGWRSAVLYLATIALSAIGSGLILDGLLTTVHAGIPTATHEHVMGSSWLSLFWSISLLGVLAYSFAARWREKKHDHDDHQPDGDTSQPHDQIELSIEGMTCGHCTAAVASALRGCRGVTSAKVDLASRQAIVAGDHLDPQELLSSVNALGYHATV